MPHRASRDYGESAFDPFGDCVDVKPENAVKAMLLVLLCILTLGFVARQSVFNEEFQKETARLEAREE